MPLLMDSTSDNDFTEDLLMMGMVSVGIYSISPIICSIQKIIISYFDFNKINSVCSVPFYVSPTCHNDVS